MRLDCQVWQRSLTWSLDLLASVDPWRALQSGEDVQSRPFGRLFLALVRANISVWCRNATGFVAEYSKLFACSSSSVTILYKKQGCMINPSFCATLSFLLWLFRKSIWPRSPLFQAFLTSGGLSKWHLSTSLLEELQLLLQQRVHFESSTWQRWSPKQCKSSSYHDLSASGLWSGQ